MRVFVPDATGFTGFATVYSVVYPVVYPVVYSGRLSDLAREPQKRGERRESPN